ncbi:hypothetical protein MNV49_003912 [Pseudohyphozyma bogoriensis]|nr:hypothetical protein MNV49_003912 [Pseudohyphozyma bogoriensis]
MNSSYSFGASTTATYTPTPPERRTVSLGGAPASRVLATTPARPSPSSSSASSNPAAFSTPAPVRSASTSAVAAAAPSSAGLATTKNVRFSPAAQTTTFTPSGAPPTRLTSFTPSRSPSYSSSLSVSPSKPSTPVAAAPAAHHPRLHKKRSLLGDAPPLGRGTVARRLRVNAVLLVVWWLSSRTNLYGFAAGHLVQVVPSLDTPLHLLESSILLLLFYNIVESMWTLNTLSDIPTTSYSSSSPRPPPKRSPSHNIFSTPVRSSPKVHPTLTLHVALPYPPATRNLLPLLPSIPLPRLDPINPSNPFRIRPAARLDGPPTLDTLRLTGLDDDRRRWVEQPAVDGISREALASGAGSRGFGCEYEEFDQLARGD